jgi:hypothetical protein
MRKRSKTVDLRRDAQGSSSSLKTRKLGALRTPISFIATAILLLFVFVGKSQAATTVSLSTPSVVAASTKCPGTNQVTIYEFTLVATGVFPNTTLTDISFSQTGTATTSDIVRYQLWEDAPGGALVATSSTSTFAGLSKIYSGLFGTTVHYVITADVALGAVAGRTIVVAPMTTGDFITTSGFKTTFGTIVGGGAQTVLLTPAAISGTTSVCIGSSVTLSNSVSGGTWTSSTVGVAAVDPVSGLLSGVSVGSAVITYQLSTGCFKTANVIAHPLPAAFTVTGGGDNCSGGSGVSVGLSGSTSSVFYQLFNGTTAVTSLIGAGSALDFGLQTTAGTYSVVATNTSTTCSRAMTGTTAVIINPLPAVFAVTGGGSYCSGSTGVSVGLSGSNTGINYRLYNGSSAVGAPVTGTGSALNFGIFTAPGTYTVLATNTSTSCTNDASGSATVVMNSLPTAYTVLGGGSYCAGGAGLHVRLSWSQVGVMYILYNGTSAVGTPVPGTGFLLDFGLQTMAGTYTVVGMNATTFCTRNMNGSASIFVNPTPAVHSVTGGGSYCAGSTGVNVGLGSSASGINYMLYNGSTVVGSPLAGTGSSLNFGLQTAAGTYTVLAVNGSTSCMSNMSGSATVVVNPLPTVYSVTGGGSYCAGGTGVNVGLTGSNTGINYQLYNGSSSIGSIYAGTGASLSLGMNTLPGIYTVMATNATTMCTNNMVGSATISVNPLPDTFTVTGGGYYCTSGASDSVITATEAGSTAHHIGLSGSQPGMIYLLQNGFISVGSPVAGTGLPLDFGVQYVAGNYTVLAINATTLCTRSMNGSAAIDINHVVVPSITILPDGSLTICAGRPIFFNTMTNHPGTSPGYLWKVDGIVVSNDSSYTYTPSDSDVVTVQLTSNAICAIPSTATYTVSMNVVVPVVPAVTISANPGTVIAPGQSVTFTANATNAGTLPLYRWYLNNVLIPGATMQTYTSNTLANDDSISVQLTRNDACGLSSFNAVVMKVGVGVQDVRSSLDQVAIAPNPNSGSFRLTGTLGTTITTDVTLTITNITGQTVYNGKLKAEGGVISSQIVTNGLNAGIYMLTLRTADERKALQLVIE